MPKVWGWLVSIRGRPAVSAAIERLSPRLACSLVMFFATIAASHQACCRATRALSNSYYGRSRVANDPLTLVRLLALKLRPT